MHIDLRELGMVGHTLNDEIFMMATFNCTLSEVCYGPLPVFESYDGEDLTAFLSEECDSSL